MAAFQLVTLGQLRLVEAGDAERLPGRRKELVLLAFVARRAPRDVSREELAALLWGERADDRARHSLRQTLLRLKQVLGPALEVDPMRLHLADKAVEIDASEFERDVSAGRYRAAIDRWGGDFLTAADDVGGEGFRTWLDREREALRRRLGFALGKLLDDAEASRSWDDATRLAERLVELRPSDETAHVRLVSALRASGRVADALARHATAAATFRDDPNTAASRRLVRLGEEIESVAGPARTRASFPGSSALLTPDLVGRDAALGELASVWNHVGKRPGVVLVDGDAGIGKTRLIAEFVRRVRGEHPTAVVLECRAADDDRDIAWATARRFLAALTRAPRLTDVSNRSLGAVATLVPGLRERFPHLANPARDNDGLVDSIREALRTIADRHPVMVVVDDVTHADPHTRDLLISLVRHGAPGTLILLAARSEELAQSPIVHEIGRTPDARRVKLQPLSASEVEALIASMLEMAPDERRTLATRLHAESDGNPFYVTELVSALADTGLLALAADGTWQLTADLAGRPLPLPGGVRGAMQQRLGSLDSDARRVLEACAGAGRLGADALRETLGVPDARLGAAVETLIARRLLRYSNEPPTSYEPTHELLRRITCELASGEEPVPRRRGLSTRARAVVAAAVVALACGGALWWGARSALADVGHDRVLVAPFTNETGETAFDPLSTIVADWLAQGIARTRLVKVVPLAVAVEDGASLGATRGRGGSPLARVRTRALDAHAGIVVWGSFVHAGDSLRFQASITDAKSGELLQDVATVAGPANTPLVAVEALRRGLLAALAPVVDQRMAAWARVASVPPSYEAYLAFAEGLDAFTHGQSDRSAVEPLLRAYALDTAFTLPLLYAAWTVSGAGDQARADSMLRLLAPRRESLAPFDRALLDFLMAAHRRDRTASYTAALAVAEIAPQSEIAAVELPFAAMAINRPYRAREILEHADPTRGALLRDNSGYWNAYAHALHMTGDYERQLAVARALRQRDPSERAALSYETRALAALGRTAELTRVLEQAIAFPVNPLWGAPGLRYYIVASDELRAHGHAAAADTLLVRAVRVYSDAPDDVRRIPKQRFEMARALYRLDRLGEAKSIFESLVMTDALQPLGDYAIQAHAHLGFIAARIGDTTTALAVDRWLTDLHDPYLLGQNTELRGALHALLGHRDEAVRLLHQAVGEGRFFDVGKHVYFEYQGLRGYAPFEEWLAPKG